MNIGAIFSYLGKGAKVIAKNPDVFINAGGKAIKFADKMIHKDKSINEAAGKVSEEYYQKIQAMFDENEKMKMQLINLEQEVEILKAENLKFKRDMLILAVSCSAGVIAAIILGILL